MSPENPETTPKNNPGSLTKPKNYADKNIGGLENQKSVVIHGSEINT